MSTMMLYYNYDRCSSETELLFNTCYSTTLEVNYGELGYRNSVYY